MNRKEAGIIEVPTAEQVERAYKKDRRERIATALMAAILSNPTTKGDVGVFIVAAALNATDALIEALDKEDGG